MSLWYSRAWEGESETQSTLSNQGKGPFPPFPPTKHPRRRQRLPLWGGSIQAMGSNPPVGRVCISPGWAGTGFFYFIRSIFTEKCREAQRCAAVPAGRSTEKPSGRRGNGPDTRGSCGEGVRWCRAAAALCWLSNQHQEMKKDSEMYGLRSKFHQTSHVSEELGIKGNLSERVWEPKIQDTARSHGYWWWNLWNLAPMHQCQPALKDSVCSSDLVFKEERTDQNSAARGILSGYLETKTYIILQEGILSCEQTVR